MSRHAFRLKPAWPCWKEFVGDAGRSISLEHFGASTDYKRLFQEFGITTVLCR